MSGPSRTTDVFRHRHGFVCWWPRTEPGGRWRRTTWLFWTWDHLPPRVGKQIQDLINHFWGQR